MKQLLPFSLLILVPLLFSCQSTQENYVSTAPIENIYLDKEFGDFNSIVVETESEVFAIDDEMKQMVHQELVPIKDTRRRAIKLLEQLFESKNINLQYQGRANLTAIQTYHAGSANCLSLTIMAYSLAKEAGLNVNFQDVAVPEYWQRNGSYNMLTGHVNLVVKKAKSLHTTILVRENVIEIDFDPFVAKKSFNKQVISKQTMLAMFYNNKGAQALSDNDKDKAYRYFKQATLTDPNFSSSWGNLGILYKINGHDQQAMYAYTKAISIDPDNNTALSNYAILLRQQGEFDKAQQIELTILKKRIKNPYYYALLGNEALHRNDFNHAIMHYRKAIKLGKNIDELYVSLANVHYQMNNYGAAKSAMRKAISINKRPKTDTQYLAKLNFLRKAEHNH